MRVLGYIPEEIGELECLKEIDFRLNKIKGTTLLSFLLRWNLILPIDLFNRQTAGCIGKTPAPGRTVPVRQLH
jgi:hypothetical protein